MPLTARELDEWSDSAEQFYSSGSWEDNPRVFAQTLFSCLLSVRRARCPCARWAACCR